MPGRIESRLAELGIELPEPPRPAAAYVPFVAAGGLVYVSGQVSNRGAELVKGKLGADMELEAGQACARLCAINLIAQAKAAAGGDLDRVTRVVKLTGFVNSAPDFGDQPKVVNGASELMGEVFGPEIGAHARSAVGVAALPFGVAVEIEGIFEIS
jgi:enamine deaminase RidA (YjgF/YER057c/UK114 family)